MNKITNAAEPKTHRLTAAATAASSTASATLHAGTSPAVRWILSGPLPIWYSLSISTLQSPVRIILDGGFNMLTLKLAKLPIDA